MINESQQNEHRKPNYAHHVRLLKSKDKGKNLVSKKDKTFKEQQ
jgi:hypothetical protein